MIPLVVKLAISVAPYPSSNSSVLLSAPNTGAVFVGVTGVWSNWAAGLGWRTNPSRGSS